MSAFRLSIRLLLATAVATALPASDAIAQVARRATALAVDEMSFAAGAEVSATLSPQGLVGFLRTTPGAGIPVDSLGGAEERAREFLASYGAAFGLGRGVELEVLRETAPDELGMEHVRFRQTYRGIPIAGGELTVHLRDRSVLAANANTSSALAEVDLVPTLGPEEAATVVRQVLAESLGVTDAELSEPRLEILDRGLLGGRGFQAELAWFVEARRIDLREYLWISARAPKVVLQFSQLTDARDRQIRDANDPGDGVYGTASLPGTLVRSEGGPAVVGGAADDANAAYDYSGDTYDYFLDVHGRDSYDGAGASLISTVRYCPDSGSCPYANAFWNGIQMVYGAGFSAADDVDAHELTHAVTEHTANLFYYMQSGALNESYSDIFGETVDLLNDAGTDTADTRWEMGEDVPGFGAIRDMEDPTLFGDPGKTSDAEFFCGDDYKLDSGGVHVNSGVPNRAYSLMVDGGSYNGQNVTGIGLTKAGKVQYRALSRYLLSASDFLDNDQALRQSCQDLIGTSGITAGDCSQVETALDAVEMSQTWPCAPTQAAVPAFCPVGQGPELWYYEDFDSAIGGLATCPSIGVSPDWCRNDATSLLGSFATSGEGSLWGYNRPVLSNLAASFVFNHQMPPANARLQFNHSHGFENDLTTNYDGGLVILSTDGGSNWFNGGGLISAGQGYGGTISNSFGNPLGGLSAFVRDSWGYTATQLDLGSLSGTAFGYGFQIGTDSAVDEYGWFVDDVRIYTCPTCLTHRVLDGDYTGMAPHYKASGTITAGDGFTVPFGDAVTLEAGTSVTLTDGFTAVGDLTVITGSGACP